MPELEKPKKERFQLDLTVDVLKRLDEIEIAMGATTRAEAIRNAIRLYYWFIKETTPGSTVKILNAQGEMTSQFKAILIYDSIAD